ncbi:PASTA domain-containing protein [Bacteroides sp. 214]|uniref:PASTA domain-containing protein n=1 Tax=Bacteroides sp. 214 TaxID=2302935 RepID=UPI0013D59409|nr:PASTA domain-containing protein [Bacteroides sp. 214]NDW12574.1 PASTA domain-containing protein [Bacteroides sp. 214]
MTIKEFFSFKKNFLFWGSLLAMVVVAGVLIFFSLRGIDRYTHHGEAVVVPTLKGKSFQEARKVLNDNDLVCVIADSTYAKDQLPGVVLEHNPESGSRVKKGRLIYLTVNTNNTPLIAVPDVADNSSFRQGEARILAAGFKLDEVELIPGERDWIYAVKYNGNELTPTDKVPVGATLTLVVGSGEEVVVTDSLAVDSAEIDESWF